MDEDGYPEESELKQIAEWPYTDIPGLLEFVQPRWSYPDRWWTEGVMIRKFKPPLNLAVAIHKGESDEETLAWLRNTLPMIEACDE